MVVRGHMLCISREKDAIPHVWVDLREVASIDASEARAHDMLPLLTRAARSVGEGGILALPGDAEGAASGSALGLMNFSGGLLYYKLLGLRGLRARLRGPSRPLARTWSTQATRADFPSARPCYAS